MTDHQTLYSYAAAALAAGALLYGYLRGANAQDEEAAAGSGFGKFGYDVRLRDIFRLAVLMEGEGRAFYMKMAARVQDPGVKILCEQLADEETAHRRVFQERLNTWRALPPNRLTWPAFLNKVRLEGFLSDPPGAGAGEDEMAAFAIRQEMKSAEFYRMFESAFPEAWKREKIRGLVQQELAHAARLRAAYPHLP